MLNIYQTCHDLLNNYIFGGTVQPDTYPDLMCVIGASVACGLVVALPFLAIKWMVNAVCRALDR